MDDIYDHSFVSTIQHHVHHISNSYNTSSPLASETEITSINGR
jgi:hypothetical protein